jgi:hypothetical protein
MGCKGEQGVLPPHSKMSRVGEAHLYAEATNCLSVVNPTFSERLPVRQIPRNRWFGGIAWAAGTVMLLASVCETQGAWSGMYGCYGPPCVVSPLDMPLTPYTMPRRPAWGGSSFAYHVKPSPQYQLCGCGWANEDAAGGSRLPYPAETADSFLPVRFERIGEIPHESLLGAGPIAPSGR